MDKLTCIRVFSQVAHLGTFTAAAQALNTTQSAVSKKVRWLEQELGFALFHRHARAVTLTDAGHHYLGVAQQLLEQLHATESALRHEQTQVSGTLTLSAPSAFSTQLLAQPLSEFLELHPQLQVNLSVSDRFVDLIEGNVDVAIRASQLKDSGLKARWFMDHQLVYFASPDYLSKQPKLDVAEDLTQHQCLTYSLSTPSDIWRFDDGHQIAKVTVNERFRSDNPEMLVAMAKQGLGVAAMPNWMVTEEINQGSLKQVLGQYRVSKLPMYLLHKDGNHCPQRIRAFIDFMVQYFDIARSN